jgi:hypothetical protein
MHELLVIILDRASMVSFQLAGMSPVWKCARRKRAMS